MPTRRLHHLSHGERGPAGTAVLLSMQLLRQKAGAVIHKAQTTATAREIQLYDDRSVLRDSYVSITIEMAATFVSGNA